VAASGTFTLVRLSGEDLALTEAHEELVLPRKGAVEWDTLEPSRYEPEALRRAAELWEARAVQELASLALFTQLASQLHLLGAPLDWSGAFARMIADETRHTDLCLRFCEALGHPAAPRVDAETLHLAVTGSLRAHVRHTVVAAFCVGETLSGRMFRRALHHTTVPLARQVVAAIVVDETFHGELGWELGALLMRPGAPDFSAERQALADALPGMFRHYARLCCAGGGPAWARRAPEVDEGPNFGTLSDAGYARAFFDGLEQDVVPGLVAIGLPEAEAAYEALARDLDAGDAPSATPPLGG
jgi:hypothetical protein